MQVTGRNGLSCILPRAGVNDLSRVRFPDRVRDSGRFQVERVIAGKRHQVETERLQRVQRLWRRQKPAAFPYRLALFRNGGLKIRKSHIALQQPLDHRQLRRRRSPHVRPDHRLPRQRNRERIRLRPRASPRRAESGQQNGSLRRFGQRFALEHALHRRAFVWTVVINTSLSYYWHASIERATVCTGECPWARCPTRLGKLRW